MIKVVEGRAASHESLKGLAVTITFHAGENVQTEFIGVKEALMDWRRYHGEACAALELEYEAEATSWPQIEHYWANKVATDPLIRSLFESLASVELCLVTPAGNDIKRIGFEVGRNK